MSIRKSSVVALVLGLAGLALLVVAVVREHHRGRYGLAGGFSWVLAWFVILAQNFSERAPMQTRGGPVTWEKSPRMYVLNFVLLGLVGLFALVVVLALALTANF